jgi:hypothetical protein
VIVEDVRRDEADQFWGNPNSSTSASAKKRKRNRVDRQAESVLWVGTREIFGDPAAIMTRDSVRRIHVPTRLRRVLLTDVSLGRKLQPCPIWRRSHGGWSARLA